MNKVNLFGASGHAKVIIDILVKNNYTINDVIDDDKNIETLLGHEVSIFSREKVDINIPFVLSIGRNKIRKILSERYSNFQFIKAMHPSSIIDVTSKISEGTVVMAGVIIISSVEIGKHCIVNTSSSIDHDCVLRDFVHISPNATLCGNVTVGEGTHIGSGAIVIPNIKIGQWVKVGAGAVITKDIPDYVIVVGNPGKIIKKNKDE